MNTLKKCLPDAIVIALFAVISFAYFLVPVSQGKILFRHDSQAGVGMGQELTEYEQRTGAGQIENRIAVEQADIEKNKKYAVLAVDIFGNIYEERLYIGGGDI